MHEPRSQRPPLALSGTTRAVAASAVGEDPFPAPWPARPGSSVRLGVQSAFGGGTQAQATHDSTNNQENPISGGVHGVVPTGGVQPRPGSGQRSVWPAGAVTARLPGPGAVGGRHRCRPAIMVGSYRPKELGCWNCLHDSAFQMVFVTYLGSTRVPYPNASY